MPRILLIAFSTMVSMTFDVMAQQIYEVRPIDLGLRAEDYAPVVIDSGIVFCSIRETSATIAFKDAETGKPLADLYWAPFKDDGFGAPVLLSANITTPVNEGPSSFTDLGRTICYTRNQVLPKKLSNLRASNAQLGLFFSQLKHGAWASPTPFEHNSNKYSVMHPAFSPDGRRLVFASDMEGGQGSVDLYVSERSGDGWSEPRNLGPGINGPGNEAFPAFAPDGTLYFASDREGGRGKLDLYSAEQSGSTWTTPQAMPEPLNSPGNDIGITFRTAHAGYFSSDRTGIDKLLAFKHTVTKFRDCTEQQRNNYCFAFRAKPHAATSSLPLDHVWDLGDGTRITGLRAEHCFKEPGTFTVRSLLVDRKTGTTFHTLKSQEFTVTDVQQAWISAPDTVRTGRTLALDAHGSYLPGVAAAEHHWDMGEGSTLQGSKVLHAFRTPGVYELKLDILTTPEADGTIHNYCSTRRIVVIDRFRDHEDQTVVATYLDAMGLTHSFEFQELPFDHLGMSSDEMADVTFAVELFASKERVSLDDPKFTEIKKFYRVVERFDAERGLYTYSVGEAQSVEELYEVFKKVKELQFIDAEVHMLHIEKLMDLSSLDFASVAELNHAKLRTNAIHFASNSVELGEGSEPVLQQILGLLRQHTELQLVIEAHTDDVGSRGANVELSQHRAQSVLDFLLKHGVAPERLVPIGHGKNQPIASNKSEEGRRLNRRVEFRLTVKGEQQAFQKVR